MVISHTMQGLTVRTRSILSRFRGYRSAGTTGKRLLTSQGDTDDYVNLKDFVFIPNFLDDGEQRILMTASLRLLDSSESGSQRRRRRKLEASREELGAATSSLQSLFLSDEFYQFEEVCLFFCMLVDPVKHRDRATTMALYIISEKCMSPPGQLALRVYKQF